jgi:hypothetical protein
MSARPSGLLALLLLAACSSPSQQPGDAGPDQTAPLPDGPAASEWAFIADAVQPPAISVELVSLSGDEATLVLTGRGMSTLQGVAFRLSFPPQQVEVVSSEVGAAWSSGYSVLARFATRPEGEIWGGIGHQGSHGIPGEGVELARLVLRLSGEAPIKLAFRPQRNLALDPGLKRLKVSWLGGRFERRAAR